MNTPKPIPELSESDKVRFWSKVNKNGPVPVHCPELGPCWLWTLSKPRRGYGTFSISARGLEKSFPAHRVSYALSSPEIVSGALVLHRCDNRACVNPGHLFIGSHLDNMADMSQKGRQVHGERQHKHRLSTEKVMEMRRRYCQGSVSVAKLAEQFGVTVSTAGYVIRGKTWRREIADGLQGQIDEIARKNLADSQKLASKLVGIRWADRHRGEGK